MRPKAQLLERGAFQAGDKQAFSLKETIAAMAAAQEDGHLKPDSNAAKNAIRPFVVVENWLMAIINNKSVECVVSVPLGVPSPNLQVTWFKCQ